MSRLENRKGEIIVDDLVEPLNKMIAEIGIDKLMKYQNNTISHGKEYQCGSVLKVNEVNYNASTQNQRRL